MFEQHLMTACIQLLHMPTRAASGPGSLQQVNYCDLSILSIAFTKKGKVYKSIILSQEPKYKNSK